MRRLSIAAALLAATCTPPAQRSPSPALEDAAGNRIEALVAQNWGLCSADGGWCVEIAGGVAIVRRRGVEAAAIPLPEGQTYAVWPFIVRAGDVILAGVTGTTSQMYSGGGGTATFLTLYDVTGATPAAVLSAPLSASALIRACFSEDDAAARQQACHDEYTFEGALGLDAEVASGAPRFLLTTEAATFPGRRNRAVDSTEAPPLQPGDLQRVRDETCSYRRVASRRGDAYVWDQPLPACADYLEP